MSRKYAHEHHNRQKDRVGRRKHTDAVVRMYESAKASSGARILGDWGVREEKNADRNLKNDPLVALAAFVQGTITKGCGCEECDARRDLITTLIYEKDLDLNGIDQAVFDESKASKDRWALPTTKCRVCGIKHHYTSQVAGTEMTAGCREKYLIKKLHDLLVDLKVPPIRRTSDKYETVRWVRKNIIQVRGDDARAYEALEIAEAIDTKKLRR